MGVGGIPPGGLGPAGSTVDQRGELILIKRQLMQVRTPLLPSLTSRATK